LIKIFLDYIQQLKESSIAFLNTLGNLYGYGEMKSSECGDLLKIMASLRASIGR
jgi:hypothetical protein